MINVRLRSKRKKKQLKNKRTSKKQVHEEFNNSIMGPTVFAHLRSMFKL